MAFTQVSFCSKKVDVKIEVSSQIEIAMWDLDVREF